MSDTSDPSRIERDLDQTRSRLGTHLSELQGRLSPGQVLDDLVVYFRGREGADVGRSLLANVRANPMPAALTGIGLAWLMATKPAVDKASSTDASRDLETFGTPGPHLYGRDDYRLAITRVRDAERGLSREADEDEPAYLARLHEVRGQAVGLARHSQETSESFGERVRDALAAAERAVMGTARDVGNQVARATGAAAGSGGSLVGSAQDIAQKTLQTAGGALSQGSTATSRAGSSLVAMLTDSPVLLGTLGLAAGAPLGALLPQSDQEEAALGEIAGQARDTATNLVHDSVERGKQAATAVMDKGVDSARSHGLTGEKSAGQLVDAALSGNLAGDAKEVLQDVLQTGDEAVRKAVASDPGAASRSTSTPSSVS